MNLNQLIKLSFAGFIGVTALGTFNVLPAISQTIDANMLNNTALTSHNNYRKIHRSPAMTINTTVKSTAQSWANTIARTGVFEHSTSTQRNGAGENLYAYYTTSRAIASNVLAQQAVTSWYSEVSKYNYSQPRFSSATGHFTQVVWKNSTGLGCGASQGKKTINGTTYNAYYVVCQYSPAGNVQGQFPQNVLKP